jgi:hypothetical protein
MSAPVAIRRIVPRNVIPAASVILAGYVPAELDTDDTQRWIIIDPIGRRYSAPMSRRDAEEITDDMHAFQAESN